MTEVNLHLGLWESGGGTALGRVGVGTPGAEAICVGSGRVEVGTVLGRVGAGTLGGRGRGHLRGLWESRGGTALGRVGAALRGVRLSAWALGRGP